MGPKNQVMGPPTPNDFGIDGSPKAAMAVIEQRAE